MRSVLRSSEGTLEAADGVFATPDGDAFPKDVGLSRFYRLSTLRRVSHSGRSVLEAKFRGGLQCAACYVHIISPLQTRQWQEHIQQ